MAYYDFVDRNDVAQLEAEAGALTATWQAEETEESTGTAITSRGTIVD